jgi:hypothetical protein
MSRHTKPVAMLIALAVLAAGCGTAAHPADAARSLPPPPSLATATAAWAVAVLGGPAASHDNFWQLLTRPSETSAWHLVTPPGVASNGGLVIATLGTGSAVAGFRPSQHLVYSPLAITHDNGAAWSPGLLDVGLADVPGAVAIAAAGRRAGSVGFRRPSGGYRDGA